jgi:hypothetical protein
MRFARLVIPSLLLLSTTLCSSAAAQKRTYESRADRLCAFDEPRTSLEEFESRMDTVLVRGSANIGTFNPRSGTVHVDALEYRDTSHGARTTGIAIRLSDGSHPVESRSLIDYDQIDEVVKKIDQVAAADSTGTKLQHFEARFRTRGDLEIAVFRQTNGGAIAARVTGGACEVTTLQLTLEELSKLRWMIVQAKARLDEIKGGQ